MGTFTGESDRGGIAGSLGKLADGIGKLVTNHLALARLELGADLKALGADAARVAAFLPFVVIGYAVLMAALSVFLGRYLPLDGALAVVGFVNLAGGAAGIWLALRRMKARRVLGGSLDELKVSAAALTPNGATKPELPHGS